MIHVVTSSFSAEELALVMQYRTLTVERQRRVDRLVATLREEERKADEAAERGRR